jgi:hypothetical protein
MVQARQQVKRFQPHFEQNRSEASHFWSNTTKAPLKRQLYVYRKIKTYDTVVGKSRNSVPLS